MPDVFSARAQFGDFWRKLLTGMNLPIVYQSIRIEIGNASKCQAKPEKLTVINLSVWGPRFEIFTLKKFWPFPLEAEVKTMSWL